MFGFFCASLLGSHLSLLDSFSTYLTSFGDSHLSAFIVSTLLVTLAEIGDKTQLLALLLIAKYRRPWPIIWGVLLATLLNHAAAAWLGAIAAHWLDGPWFSWLLGLSFIAMGLWMLIPDRLDDEDTPQRWFQYGPFIATLVLFFIAEMGDKTQVATVALGAHFEQALISVILGTTAGMLAANLPVILAGHLLFDKISLDKLHWITALLFIGLGLWTLLW